jgi:hypothetical protein
MELFQDVLKLDTHQLAKKIEAEAQSRLEKGEFTLVDSARKYTEAMKECEGVPLGLESPKAVKARAACDEFVKEFESYRKGLKGPNQRGA